MIRYYDFSEDDVKELNRMMYTLYKFFSQKVEGMEPKTTPTWDLSHDINLRLRPWAYFVFTYGAVKISIHHLRNDKFTLEIFGYVPKTLKPLHYRTGRVTNNFGHFDSLSSAIDNYSEVVREFVLEKLGALF